MGTDLASHPRERMIWSAVQLLSERGVAGVTVDEVLARSGAPRGSVYHHFPGGRSEIVQEATRRAGGFISDWMREAATKYDAVELLAKTVAFRKKLLTNSDFSEGCPVAGAIDTPRETADLALEAFAEWQDLMTSALVRDGVAKARARRLAAMAIASIEGGILLARAGRSTKPLDDVRAELEVLLAAATSPCR